MAARALGVAAAAVVLGGCATKGDIRDLRTEVVAELRAQAARQDSLMALLSRATTSTQDTLRTQTDQLFDFRGEITRLLQSISQGQTRLEAIVGENQRGLASLRAQVASGAVAARPGTGQDLTLGDAQAPSTGAETLPGVGGTDAGQLYEVARSQHQRGSLSAAQQAYEQFLSEFPNDQRAPDAHWFLADLLAERDRPDDALEAFQEIPTRYPTAARVPDALFRIARLQVELGDEDGARQTLERLVNTYPDAPVTSLAREMLEELG